MLDGKLYSERVSSITDRTGPRVVYRYCSNTFRSAGTGVSPDLPSNLRALEQGCMMCGHRSGCPEGSASIAAGVVPCLDFLHGRSKPTAPVGTAGVLSEQRFAHSIKYMTVCLLRCMCWPASADACKLLAEAKRLSCQGCSTNGAHA